MKHRSGLFLLLPLLMAACGAATAPAPTATAQNVKLHLGTAGKLGAQGLPTGTFAAGSNHFKVKVLSSNGSTVTFRDGVYAPAGDGDTFLTLNLTNNFSQDLLLPEGKYTFVTAVKDGPNETATEGTLLAYSQSTATQVDADHSAVQLKVSTVMNPAALALNFAMPTDKVYTNDVLDLRLHVKTNALSDGTSYGVPTADYSVGSYTASQATLNQATASKLGVSSTAQGSIQDPSMSVTVPVTGWVQTGPETAEQMTTAVTFQHAVVSGTIGVDVTPPVAQLDTVTAYLGGPATVTGNAQDVGGSVEVARLYDNSQLVATTDAGEQEAGVSALTFADGSANFSAVWTPATSGTHTLSLIVNDASGNETRIDQNVQVSDVVVLNPASDPTQLRYTLHAGETRQFHYVVGDILNNTYIEQYIVIASYWSGSYGCDNPTFPLTVSVKDAETGEAVDMTNSSNCYTGTYVQKEGESIYNDAHALRDLIFTVTNPSGQDIEINPYFHKNGDNRE